jgi:hypothetical protein
MGATILGMLAPSRISTPRHVVLIVVAAIALVVAVSLSYVYYQKPANDQSLEAQSTPSVGVSADLSDSPLDSELEKVARALAAAADALSASNPEAEAYIVSDWTVDQAATEFTSPLPTGLVMDQSYGAGVRVSLTKNGTTTSVCVEPIQRSTGEFAGLTRAGLRAC